MPRTKKYLSSAQKQKAYRERKKREKRNEEALLYTEFDTSIKRPVLRYPGGKFKISSWIIDLFPEHECYCEPFCGGASVFFRKYPSKFEIINDLNSDIVNFFDLLRSKPDELIRAIELTPYSREIHNRAYHAKRTETDPIQRAVNLYVSLWQSFGTGVGKTNSGWRYQHTDNRGTTIVDNDWNNTERLYLAAKRLKMAMIEHDDAFNIIDRFDTPDTLFYVDPPYLPITRSSKWSKSMYSHELSIKQHIHLAEVLNHIDGMAILSGYESDLYKELYLSAGWQIEKKSATTNGNNTAIECLYLSPRVVAARCQ